MHITELVAALVLQIGVILFAVRLFGHLAKKIGIPSVLGELTAGVIIGPYALGGISIPMFPHGIFPLALTSTHTLAVSTELYAFATIASIVLLFSSGLETDLRLFLRYSIAGGIVGISGALLSFAVGTLCGVIAFKTSILDPRCLFLGVIAITTSVGISARTLSERKKMDSPEGVTILAAAVIDDVVWIVLLAVVMGIVSILGGQTGSGLSAVSILLLAGRVFGIWFVVTAIFLLTSQWLAKFLKLFKSSLDFSVLALGIGLILAGLLEKQGLALIIGAYIAGLSLSKTDIAAKIQNRIRPLYEFFVPMFFAIMGMMVNIREVISPPVLIFGAVYTLAVILSKVIGAGGLSLLLGFNRYGALRIGAGMIPRGEGALISCGIGLAAGVFSNQIFSAAVLMIFLTIVVSTPMLGFALKINKQGTRRQVKDNDTVREVWEFESEEIAYLVMSKLIKELRTSKFFVQTRSIGSGLSSQAHKGDISIIIIESKSVISISTAKTDMPFVKNEIYEAILDLSHLIEKLKNSANPEKMKKELLDSDARTTKDILALIDPKFFSMNLKGESKDEVIKELVDMLADEGKLLDRNLVLTDVLERELSMSTGMELGIAMPHAKTDGIAETMVVIGIKKEGVNFDSFDGELSHVFILIVSPKQESSLHVQFLAAVGSIFGDETVREKVINAETPQEAVQFINEHDNLLQKERKNA
ncbi:MAG: cation:proton antiporter [Treponema sp.]|nr:cation:proton antiporter [Treponema sp.]